MLRTALRRYYSRFGCQDSKHNSHQCLWSRRTIETRRKNGHSCNSFQYDLRLNLLTMRANKSSRVDPRIGSSNLSQGPGRSTNIHRTGRHSRFCWICDEISTTLHVRIEDCESENRKRTIDRSTWNRRDGHHREINRSVARVPVPAMRGKATVAYDNQHRYCCYFRTLSGYVR